MIDRLYGLLLRVFGRLPRPLRRQLVRAGSPKFTVGAVCFVQRSDGDILFVRHSYWDRWGTPGGLSKRGEPPTETAVRETTEEVNLDIVLIGAPAVVVEPHLHRVDIVFLARPAPGAALGDVRPNSAEITRVGWFRPDGLPDLQSETSTALVALARTGIIDLPGSGITPSSARPTR
ncbi:MAG: NUDIX hydrolase [Acidimicrobiales bacterium]